MRQRLLCLVCTIEGGNQSTRKGGKALARGQSRRFQRSLKIIAIAPPLHGRADPPASCKQRSARPTMRMQWCTRPGPSRPCAISKPRPSPNITASQPTCTSSRSTSAWPWGASSYLHQSESRMKKVIVMCIKYRSDGRKYFKRVEPNENDSKELQEKQKLHGHPS